MNWRRENTPRLILSLLLLTLGLLFVFSFFTSHVCNCSYPCTCPISASPQFQILRAFLAGTLMAAGATVLLLTKRHPPGTTQFVFDHWIQTLRTRGRTQL